MVNAITALRILCAGIILFCPAFSDAFFLFYLLGGVSDALDGFLARLTHSESSFGARLDTIADAVFTVVVLGKMLSSLYFPPWLFAWIAAVAVIKAVGIVCAFVRYGHFVAEHTALNKVCGLLLFAIPLCVGRFPWQSVAVLCIVTCAVATIASVQELYLICKGKEKE